MNTVAEGPSIRRRKGPSLEASAFIMRIVETAESAPVGKGVALYAIRLNDTVKIGLSANPKQRMADLQFATSGHLELAKTWRFHNRLAAYRAEKVMHELFAHVRLNGEWFEADIDQVVKVADELYHYFRANYRGPIFE